ncbi:MAG: hypothetical protein ABUK01_04005 [Leptospirales bacterium]
MPPREVNSKIRIDSSGEWFNNTQKIENQQILLFFKQHLQYDHKGVFIENEFKEMTEKVYVQVEGPLVNVLHINRENFILETGEKITTDSAFLTCDEQERIYLGLKRLKSWARITRQAKMDLGEKLEKTDQGYMWNEKLIKMVAKMTWHYDYNSMNT